ncbi:biosynthetic arginine decarboxylase [Nitratidesulfovibrio vulgaris]|uniref:Arginine decarboxylase n=1 Tax=Nitratidesulfovibrio vulgaris (strain DP4) TaxID=391774 RepID=A0A0H3AA95_NITV4|nr:biosynthetic arginine decarboxylase [Nitratidesulfovibrio vulgaris]ABM29533.1 arginine decarboxylase [Nitratidesulfovibrio vulgaris DP4]ADP85550.1 arginine decarboxylase [Nitratidesulfovibrio vulgaris RCH1]WCB47126.1 biosynthetic arginine decarboxylase [Nitratidesulfovibrio vulgaris]GEB80048.1 arginine decarboxylase [Desulfovibrio desulfuricans]
MARNRTLQQWGVEDSAELYGIRNWGAGYFDVAQNGDVVVYPFGHNRGPAVSIPEIIGGMRERGYDMPVLLRIENILDSQITSLHTSFRNAIGSLGYKGEYRGIFPIKVNQQQQVVEKIAQFGSHYHHGLEVGSKAELIAAVSQLRDREACLVCNGYKDEEFIDLGLHAVRLGFMCIFVLEMPGELDLILERGEALGVKPIIGVRAKLSVKAGGHWTDSGGERSTFGLTTSQIVDVVDRLKEKGMLDCFKLLHYHLGSQVPNIRDIRAAVMEACRIYAGLVQEGAAMGFLDLGGGLAVDYDGSHTNFVSSRNYTLDEYCADIVEAVMTTLDEQNIPHPHIVTESGRATVAYYSMLLFNILDVSRVEIGNLPDALPEDTPEPVRNMREVLAGMTLRNLQECYNDALYYRDAVRQLFLTGQVTLRQRTLSERLFWAIMKRIAQEKQKLKHVPKDLAEIDVALADIYYGNFSVFQSLPDSWAIDQLFPVMPVHRLQELPSRQGILSDITCDSDGRIDHFIDPQGMKGTLDLHPLRDGEEYYLGVFLVGAYQETLGDLHNLLGDTNVVSVRVHEDGTYEFVREIRGDSVADILSYVEYDPRRIYEDIRELAERAVREGRITASDRFRVMQAYEDGLRGYTYFER